MTKKKAINGCKLCFDKEQFRNSGFCRSCVKKIVHDAGILIKHGSVIRTELLKNWLEKNENSNHLLFINGHFNAHPESLLMSQKLLSTIDLKMFWERFKYHKNLYT